MKYFLSLALAVVLIASVTQNLNGSVATFSNAGMNFKQHTGIAITDGTFSASFVDVGGGGLPLATVTITATGKRPMWVGFSGPGATISCGLANGCAFALIKDGTTTLTILPLTSTASIPSQLLFYIDTPTAGSHTYKAQYRGNGTNSVQTTNIIMTAVEL